MGVYRPFRGRFASSQLKSMKKSHEKLAFAGRRARAGWAPKASEQGPA